MSSIIKLKDDIENRIKEECEKIKESDNPRGVMNEYVRNIRWYSPELAAYVKRQMLIKEENVKRTLEEIREGLKTAKPGKEFRRMQKEVEHIGTEERQSEEVSINEMRKEYGLPPIENGDVKITKGKFCSSMAQDYCDKKVNPLIEDQKEIAPCGMNIRYTLDKATDFVTYTNINNRGEYKLCESCKKCSWKGICKPTECNYMKIIQEALGRAVDPLDVIKQIYEQAAAGYESETVHYGDGTLQMRVKKQPYMGIVFENGKDHEDD